MLADLGLPSWPLFTGSLSASGNGGGNTGGAESGSVIRTEPETVVLDGWTYAIDLKEYRFANADTFRDSVVQGDESSDALFSAKGAWSRYRYSWHQGADQELADLDADAVPFRFNESRGVNVWEKYDLSLQHSTTRTLTVTDGNPVMIRSGIYVFVSDGTALKRTTDLTTWTTMTAPGGTIQSMTTDGSDLYVATSTGLVKYVGTATTSTAFSTAVSGDVSLVAFVANRLLIGVANVLSSVGSTGTLTNVSTHFQTGFRWTTAFAIGSRIYVGGFAGVRSELYTLGVDPVGGALFQAQEAAPFPTGELLRTGLSYAGAALLCTSKGARLAQVGADGTLTYGPLIEAVGDVRCAAADGRFAHVGWSDFQTSGAGTARLALDQFVNVLQPAYASDVFATPDGTVTGIARLLDRTAFVLATDGVYVESDTNYESTGWVSSGRIHFGTVEPKGLLEVEVKFDALNVSESVAVRVTNSAGVQIGYAEQTVANETTLRLDLDGQPTTWCEVSIFMSGPGTTTPHVDRWRMRAYPVPPKVMQWIVPIRAHEVVLAADGQGRDLSQNIIDMRDRFVGLWSSREQVTYREGDRAYRVRVEGFEFRPVKWTDDGTYLQGLFLLQLMSTT